MVQLWGKALLHSWKGFSKMKKLLLVIASLGMLAVSLTGCPNNPSTSDTSSTAQK